MTGSLKSRTLENVGYNSVAKIVGFGLQAVTSVILARTLTSTDYGIVGFALIFTNFLWQFSNFGIAAAAIQKGELSEAWLHTAFTIAFVLGIIVFVASFLAAPLSTLFFDNGAVVDVIRVLSLNYIVNGLWFIPRVLLTRELNYGKLSAIQLVSALVTSASSLALALTGFGYWSIVAGSMFGNVATAVSMNWLRPAKIRFKFQRDAAWQTLRFGGNIFLSLGIIPFMLYNADNFIVGAMKGPETLGYYVIAFNWGAMTCTVLGTVVFNVLMPTFSKMQSDLERLKKAYCTIMEYIGFISVLTNVSLLVVSKEFLVFILGHGTDKWMPALPALRVLCVYGVLKTLLQPATSLLASIGKPGLVVKAVLVSAVIEISLLYPALTQFGIEGVAVIVTFAYSAQYFVYLPILRREFKLNIHDLREILMPAIVSIPGILVVIPISRFFMGFSALTMIEELVLSTACYTLLFGLITKWRLVRELRFQFLQVMKA